ncbi:hypothetical protein J2Z66_002803 [Paenibacillus eucommiae]|uniref:Uncharacterized protein n=1 Tax=Paenibacillus eucommiae TaxID=1355755 RepID=A0ABS4IWG5_9BACL|nr:hypothetical protein [Paenibacillus eucommiae]
MNVEEEWIPKIKDWDLAFRIYQVGDTKGW